ncbi:histidine kinase [Ruminococcus sp. AM42-11]|uniref:sensor histidine kinase n=1 Tax=Ruminococcus sp. AM42-11 TaxID=2292372 RepID=UPI00325AB171
MKYKEKLKYISNRALVLGTVVFGSFIILAVIQLLLAYKGETPWWIAIIITIFAILFPTVFWLWIHRPYMRCEKMMDRFLEGYIFSEKEDMELLNLTPSIQKQMKMVDRIVRSPQYMDLNKRQAQYLALQNQINPHFLYNTLESIRGEAIIAGLDSIADMTEAWQDFSVTPLPRWRIWFLWRKNWITVRLISEFRNIVSGTGCSFILIMILQSMKRS